MRPDTFRYFSIAALLVHMLLLATPAIAGIRLAAGTAYYSGPISAELNQQLLATVKGKAVKRLVITSSGGEVEAGIALGLWVFDHRLNVEVTDYCLSSCANYVFPAGHRKSIAPGAIVAWHGNYHHLQQTGLWRDDIAVRMERHGEDAATAEMQARELVDRLASLEQDFFAHIGVNEFICWIGKLPPYSAPNYYFLSRKDMARFGVSNVQTPPDYENTDVSGFSHPIRYITLSPSKPPRAELFDIP